MGGLSARPAGGPPLLKISMKKVFIVAFIAIVSALVSCSQNAEIAKLTAQIDSLTVAVQQLQADQFEMKDQIQALQRRKSSSTQQTSSAAQSESSSKASSAQETSAKSKSEAKSEAKSESKSESKSEAKSESKSSTTASSASVSGYYMKIGTKSELKSAGLLDKNVIKKGIVNTEGLNMSIFKKIDIRSTREIKIKAYKPKLLTNHPNKSYEMKLDEDSEEDITYLKIKDIDAFWSQSHFLVIQY